MVATAVPAVRAGQLLHCRATTMAMEAAAATTALTTFPRSCIFLLPKFPCVPFQCIAPVKFPEISRHFSPRFPAIFPRDFPPFFPEIFPGIYPAYSIMIDAVGGMKNVGTVYTVY